MQDTNTLNLSHNIVSLQVLVYISCLISSWHNKIKKHLLRVEEICWEKLSVGQLWATNLSFVACHQTHNLSCNKIVLVASWVFLYLVFRRLCDMHALNHEMPGILVTHFFIFLFWLQIHKFNHKNDIDNLNKVVFFISLSWASLPCTLILLSIFINCKEVRRTSKYFRRQFLNPLIKSNYTEWELNTLCICSAWTQISSVQFNSCIFPSKD